MVTRRLGVSEARRLLPRIVESIARDGGRVDITHRGEPKVSILRVSDVRRGPRGRAGGEAVPPALRIELLRSEDLVEVVRSVRARQGYPRRDWLVESTAVARPKRRRKAAR